MMQKAGAHGHRLFVFIMPVLSVRVLRAVPGCRVPTAPALH